MPVASHASRAAPMAVVLPVPAGPTMTATPSPSRVRRSTIARCSSERCGRERQRGLHRVGRGNASPGAAQRHRGRDGALLSLHQLDGRVATLDSLAIGQRARPPASPGTRRRRARAPAPSRPGPRAGRAPGGPRGGRRSIRSASDRSAPPALRTPRPRRSARASHGRAAARSAPRRSPSLAARRRHSGASASGRTARSFARRVSSAATWAAWRPLEPWSSIAASISARRREKARMTRLETPRISAEPLLTGVHSTPSERVSSARSAAW